ncbi:MAG: antibiotic biosynthesis monooxygenase [Thermodesulfobacteriota bacterium]
MIKVIFNYEVSPEKQDEYLKVTDEKIKPFWESHGCRSYSVWQMMEQPSTFVKEMVFQDLGEMKRVMALDEANPVKELFYTFAGNVSRKVCSQKV